MSNSQSAFAPPLGPRFRVEPKADGGQRIVIPAQRSLFVMAFLLVWLCGWTFGGVNVAHQLTRQFEPFLAFWLCGWALGEAAVICALLWMTFGRETLRSVGGNLEISASIFGLARRRLYRAADMRSLSAAADVRAYNGRGMMDIPLLWTPRSGAVKFSYGGRTVYAGVGLDETEGRAIVDLLKQRLPKSAF